MLNTINKKDFFRLHAEFKFRVTPRNALKGNELRVNELWDF